mmetsp:Transcript_3525/g.8240  ORF Transcript_3525/g.8240 Transcript_3525/m.8240 type:complete len:238 (-) Transcript_3525:107-820(-)
MQVLWNHGCSCSLGGLFDVGGMDAAVLFNTFYLVALLLFRGETGAKAPTWQGRAVVSSVFGAYGVLCVSIYAFNDDTLTEYAFALGIILAISLAAFHALLYRKADRAHPEIFAACVVSLGCGFGSWIEEYSYQTCRWSRTSPVQPHAIWHFFTAWSLVLSYAYLRAMGTSSWGEVRVALFLQDGDAVLGGEVDWRRKGPWIAASGGGGPLGDNWKKQKVRAESNGKDEDAVTLEGAA